VRTFAPSPRRPPIGPASSSRSLSSYVEDASDSAV